MKHTTTMSKEQADAAFNELLKCYLEVVNTNITLSALNSRLSEENHNLSKLNRKLTDKNTVSIEAISKRKCNTVNSKSGNVLDFYTGELINNAAGL